MVQGGQLARLKTILETKCRNIWLLFTTPTTMTRPQRAKRWSAISMCSTKRWRLPVPGSSPAACNRRPTRNHCVSSPAERWSSPMDHTLRPRNTLAAFGCAQQQDRFVYTNLLGPISAEHPAGEDLSDVGVFAEIEMARRSDDPEADWVGGRRDLKKADWPAAHNVAAEALEKRSKDLRLAIF